MFYFSVGLDKIPVMTWCLNINAGDTCDALRVESHSIRCHQMQGRSPEISPEVLTGNLRMLAYTVDYY